VVGYDNILRERGTLMLPDPRLTPSNKCLDEDTTLGDHGHPIEFDFDLARLIQSEMVAWKCDCFPITYCPPKMLEPHVRSEIYRFMLALKSYYESSNPLIPYKDLIDGILEGPKYMTFLKKLKSVHLVRSTKGRFLEDDPDLERVRQYSDRLPPIKDVGDIFNQLYWFYWAQDDPKDWEACFIPLRKIKQEHLDILYQTVLDILPDEVAVIEEQEILISLSGSSSKNSTEADKTSPVFINKQSRNFFSKDPLHGKECFIDSKPGDTRNSIILSVEQSNSVKLIEKQVALLAAEVPFSCYVKDDEEYFKRYNSFQESSEIFLCRDFKKDGLTKPRPLIQTVCRAIKDKYPHLPACKYFSIYDDFFITINKEKFNPPRGVGLGMSSALTTILQSAIFKITRDRTYDLREVNGDLFAILYHDDTAIGATEQDTLEEYNMEEDLVMEEFGLIKNKRKSFVTDWFVLCENYSIDKMDEKESYQRYMLNQALASVNICHAKHVFGSNLRYIHTVDWKHYLKLLTEKFGYEYWINEAASPYQLGGWVPAYYMNVDLALYLKEPDRFEKSAGLSFTMEKPNAYRRLKKYPDSRYISPTEQIFGTLSVGENKESYYYDMTVKEVARYFLDMRSIGAKPGFWNYVYKQRQLRFDFLMKTPEFDIKDFYYLYHKKHAKVDILPPRTLLTKSSVDHFEKVDKVYTPTNPYLQYLKFLNPEKLPRKIVPWPIPPGMNYGNKLQLTAEERRQISYSPLLLQQYNIGELILINHEPRLIISDQWYNPNQVLSCMISLNEGENLPNGLPRKSLEQISQVDPKLFKILSNPLSRIVFENVRVRFPDKVPDLIQNMTMLCEEVYEVYANKQRALALIQVYTRAFEEMQTIPSTEDLIPPSEEGSFIWTDTPLEDDQYFNWVTSKKNYRDWRNEYFRNIESAFITMETLETVVLNNVADRDEWLKTIPAHCFLGEVERHLYETSGGTMNKHGYPEVNTGNFLDRDPDEEADIFNASDGESDCFGEGIWG